VEIILDESHLTAQYTSGPFVAKAVGGDIVENMHFSSELFIDRKRAMPRQARLDSPGTPHHVVIRGMGKWGT